MPIFSLVQRRLQLLLRRTVHLERVSGGSHFVLGSWPRGAVSFLVFRRFRTPPHYAGWLGLCIRAGTLPTAWALSTLATAVSSRTMPSGRLRLTSAKSCFVLCRQLDSLRSGSRWRSRDRRRGDRRRGSGLAQIHGRVVRANRGRGGVRHVVQLRAVRAVLTVAEVENLAADQIVVACLLGGLIAPRLIPPGQWPACKPAQSTGSARPGRPWPHPPGCTACRRSVEILAARNVHHDSRQVQSLFNVGGSPAPAAARASSSALTADSAA